MKHACRTSSVVAYCLDFRGLIFRFGALRNENKTPDENVPLLYSSARHCVLHQINRQG